MIATMRLTETVVTAMSTTVAVQVVGDGHVRERIDTAVSWFPQVEAACSRFLPDSELRRLCAQVGRPVPVSPLLFNALTFALAVADASDGAFDPTVGAQMEAQGFATNWRDARPAASGVPTTAASWRDVELNAADRTVRLHRPLLLDLGAVAKGLAVDLAAESLADLEHFVIDAGGDLYCAGTNADGAPWTVGIQHPRDATDMLTTLTVQNAAVCTSGDYVRRRPPVAEAATGPAGETTVPSHHLWHPGRGRSATALISATVVAPRAMVADALATAAFVMGPTDGIAFLHAHQVEGLLVTPELTRVTTTGFAAVQRTASRHAH